MRGVAWPPSLVMYGCGAQTDAGAARLGVRMWRRVWSACVEPPPKRCVAWAGRCVAGLGEPSMEPLLSDICSFLRGHSKIDAPASERCPAAYLGHEGGVCV